MNSNIICDIIIPVYNALDDLKECIASILKYTDKKHRVIVINDCSPDPQVKVFLNSLKYDNIIICDNPKNLGFVGTVNVGMRKSSNDVVLLNSDTIVTKGWLDKLIAAAYSNASIATVTPFTNNGTICSIPRFNEDNPLPSGHTIDTFAEMVEKVSQKLYPEIPTAVGFCMYIKREIIDKIGYFDEETFGKGYGEENDFCCRALEYGYTHILADDTFIYHKGSMSFQGAKAELVNRNLGKLNKRYPNYEKNVHDFIFRRNPLRKIHEVIRASIPLYANASKKNILFVLHNFFDEPFNFPIGGTEYHVKDLVSRMKGYDCFVLVSNTESLVLKQYRNGKLISKMRFELLNKIHINSFHSSEYASLVEKIMVQFNIGLVHVHQLIMHTFDIPFVAKKLGIPVVVSIHDFYYFCPKINLLDLDNKYCKETRSVSKCTSCLAATHGFHNYFLDTWKKHVSEMFGYVDLFIVPSNSTKKLYDEEYPEIKDKLFVIPHGIDMVDDSERTRQVAGHPKGKLRIGFIGGLSPTKGSDIIFKVVTKMPKDKYEWHLIGGIGDQRLNLLKQDNVIKYGEYERDDLSRIIQSLNLDIIALLSPWPETYSYTLSEAWKNGIPVLVTPIGALGERVLESKAGWVTKGLDIQDILITFEDLSNLTVQELEEARKNVANLNLKSLDEMVAEYNEIYSKYYKDIQFGEELRGLDSRDLLDAINYYLPKNDDVITYAEELKAEIDEIKSTIGWKVLNKLRERNSFLLKLGKKMIYLALKYNIKYFRK